MLFTSSERRLLALLVLFLASGYLLTFLRGAGVRTLPSPGEGPSPSEGALAPGPFDEDALPPVESAYSPAGEEDPPGGDGDESPDAPPSPALTGRSLPSGPQNANAAQETPRAGAQFVNGYLDLNRADSVSLVALPGIGPALAGRILAARREAGGFREVGDLRRVRGIGPRRLEELARLVTVGEPPAGRSAGGASARR